jgi:Flp pilus assembly protein TadG
MLKILKNSRNIFRQQSGVGAVEFAIIAMLLFTLLFGILEFGRMFYLFNTV